jgi:RHS repeat-associated protein
MAGSIIRQFVYGYDKAGNRTSESIQSGISSPAVNNGGFNSLNQLTSLAVGGAVRFKGHLSETGTVLVAGSPAVIAGYTNFSAYAQLAVGTNTNSVVAMDLNGNVTSNRYQVVIRNNGVAETLTYDPNGNLTSAVSAKSTNSYEWDAVNRLTAINSATNRSEFTYDGIGRRVRIIDKVNGLVQSDKRFLWVGVKIAEERDSGGGTVTKRFFGGGEQISGTNYFFTTDHLGSIREMTDSSGAIRARYDYDPYGSRTKVLGDLESDYGFTGHYVHAPSGLHLALYRAYDAGLGRWLNRDPINERGGVNLYAYVKNSPINGVDLLGLCDAQAGDPLDWLSNHASEAFQYGGFLGNTEGVLANTLQTVLGSVFGGELVKALATKAGCASGAGRQGQAVVFGLLAVAAMVLAVIPGGGKGVMLVEEQGIRWISQESAVLLSKETWLIGLVKEGEVLAIARADAIGTHAELAAQVGIDVIDRKLPALIEGFTLSRGSMVGSSLNAEYMGLSKLATDAIKLFFRF